MAAVDFLRSSSPPMFAGCQTFTMSSSPVFPSPGALVRDRLQSRSDARAVPIPLFATQSFTTVATIVDDPPIAMATLAPIDHAVAGKITKTKVVRKRSTATKITDGADGTAKKPRKSRSKKAGEDSENKAITIEKAPRKPRAKKAEADGQTKIPKGRITKASAGALVDKVGKRNKTEVVSSHFAFAGNDDTDPFEIFSDSKNSLLLQAAIKRRKTWTPPKTVAAPSGSVLPIIIGEDDIVDDNTPMAKQKTIAALLANFSYNENGETSCREPAKEPAATKKRKLIDLDDTNKLPPDLKPIKVKAMKKKPRTITELATSAYAVDENQGELSPLSAPILKYCTRMDSSTEGVVTETTDGFKIPPKPRSKGTAKASSKSKAKKGKAENPILLSPQSALKHVEKQEFVFGTSSQLAREDSPTLLRDLQQAMQASNQVEADIFAEIEYLSPSKSVSGADGGTEAYVARRNLWSAASHGFDGSLTHVETIDMSKSPHASMLAKAPEAEPARLDTVSDPLPISVDDKRLDLEVDETPQEKVDPVVKLPPPSVNTSAKPINVSELSRIPTASNEIKIISKAAAAASKTRGKDEIISGPKPCADKPDYNSYPTAKLAKEIASYRFKPVKNRDQMILLLEKCWEGRQQVAAGRAGSGPEPALAALDSNKPLVLRQTPKKPKKRKVSPIPEEIDDSDSPMTPSPPRRCDKIRTPTPVLQLSVSDNLDESIVLSPTSQQIQLHKHITRAITSAPPSEDPTNPTWHEKILLYDPIILEDLAAWLNTGALQKAGWDGEVSPQEVKRWCLEKSICCLWKENLRGEARSRF